MPDQRTATFAECAAETGRGAAPATPPPLERQLAAAQQITHIGSWEWDLREDVVRWSDELYRIYGLPPQSVTITFESFLARLHPDDRQRVADEVRAALERGGRFAYPERIIRPDGSLRELDTVGEALHDESGRTIGLLGTCRDVTDDRVRDRQLRLYADIVRNAQTGLCVWKLGPQGAEGSGARLEAFNPAMQRATKTPLAELTGHTLAEVFPSPEAQALEAMFDAVAKDRRVREAEHRLPDSTGEAHTFAVKAFALSDHHVGLALEDVTAQALARRLQEAEQRVLELVASGATLEESLTQLVLAIEEYSPTSIASILLLDDEGRHVRHGAAPNLPDAYNRAIDGLPIGPSAGSCGTAAYLRRPVFVTDIETDPLWADYRDIARQFGLRACWSTPILASDGRVLGTFARYYRAPRAPSTTDVEVIARATHVARIAIERRRLDEQLRALTARLEAARENERTGIAREIHDELGQALTAIKFDLAWAARKLASPAGEAAPVRTELLERLRAAAGMTDEVIQQVRRISTELRPGVLDDLGLLAALEWQAQDFEKRTGVACVVRSNLGSQQLERDVSTALFRVFKEALTNVARHAHATRVEVRLERVVDTLHLEVLDDGRGISLEAAHGGRSLGLLGMSERVRRFGGFAEVNPAPGGGTLVSVELPLVPTAERGGPRTPRRQESPR